MNNAEFKENIKNYIFLKDGIKDLEDRIKKIENQRKSIKDSVKGSHREFPYTIHTCVVEGKEKDERLKRRKKLLHNKKKELEKIKDELEIYVNTEIKDEQIRQLFMYRYIDKFSWVKIAHKMNGTESGMRMLHNRFLEKI